MLATIRDPLVRLLSEDDDVETRLITLRELKPHANDDEIVFRAILQCATKDTAPRARAESMSCLKDVLTRHREYAVDILTAAIAIAHGDNSQDARWAALRVIVDEAMPSNRAAAQVVIENFSKEQLVDGQLSNDLDEWLAQGLKDAVIRDDLVGLLTGGNVPERQGAARVLGAASRIQPPESTEAIEPQLPSSRGVSTNLSAVTEPDEGDDGGATEKLLRDAVNLIAATAPQAIKLHAINQVRGIVESWADHDDERRMFAGLISLGLAELDAFVRGDSPMESPDTIVTSLRKNIEHAMQWANDNGFLRFGAHLAWILPFLDKLF